MRIGFLTAWIKVGLLLALTGCTVQLAPPYEEKLVTGLETTGKSALTLFARVSDGVGADTFNSRVGKYNDLIGSLDALAVAAGARPTPDHDVIDKINEFLAEKGGPPLNLDDGSPPSQHAIQKMSETVETMRNADKKNGLSAITAKAFKGQFLIYFDQAITYEKFLQR